MSGDHNQYQKATGCEMNTDLIRRLEKQCWNYQANCLDAEKFAQLIVEECIQAIQNEGQTYEHLDAGEFQANNFSQAVKQHFGVEE
jgi:hypothetical protein